MGASSGLNDSSTVELTGKIMVAAVIVLFLIVIFVLSLHLFAKWFWWRTEETPNSSDRRQGRRRFVFNPEQEDPTRAVVSRGLDQSVLMSLPVFVFGHEEVKEGFECAVCLCELVDGEKARVLPKCKHGFHVDCIDMWFQSHSTCPLCRNRVSTSACSRIDSSVSGNELGDDWSVLLIPNRLNVDGYSSEVRDFPTNVLFWGNQTQVSSVDSSQVPCSSSSSSSSSLPSSSSSRTNRLEGRLVIDIPNQNLGEILLQCSHSSDEEMKLPLPTRLRSLKRLLSREQRVVACSHSSIDV